MWKLKLKTRLLNWLEHPVRPTKITEARSLFPDSFDRRLLDLVRVGETLVIIFLNLPNRRSICLNCGDFVFFVRLLWFGCLSFVEILALNKEVLRSRSMYLFVDPHYFLLTPGETASLNTQKHEMLFRGFPHYDHMVLSL